MQESNANKAAKNVIAQLIYQAVVFALGITIPRLVIVNLGSDSNGLLNSVNQAVTYLSLLEGGIGLTIMKALYGPVAVDNRDEINGVLAAGKHFFTRVGYAYFIGVVAISIIFPFTIETTLSPWIVFGVVILTALPQVVNFLFTQHYRMLISVTGNGYHITRLNTITYVGSNLVKILLLKAGYGLIAVQSLYFIIQMVQTIYIILFAKREWAWLNMKVPPLQNRIGKRSAVFVHQIAGYIFSSTDMLILTYFCDLRTVSVYSIYTIVCSTATGLGAIFNNSFSFVMGQIFYSDFPKYQKMHNAYETINMTINFVLIFVLYQCLTPFMKLYTAGVSDAAYIDSLLPVLFVATQLLQAGRYSSQKAIEYAGEFQNTRSHALMEAIVNLVVSLVGAKYLGVYGVLLGTIVAIAARNIVMIRFACRKVIHVSAHIYWEKWIINILLFLALTIACNELQQVLALDTYINLLLYAIVLVVFAVVCFAASAFLYDKKTILICRKAIEAKLRKKF